MTKEVPVTFEGDVVGIAEVADDGTMEVIITSEKMGHYLQKNVMTEFSILEEDA